MADTAGSKRDTRRIMRRSRSRRHNPDGTMSLLEHVYEFRRRLSYALLAIVLGGIIGFIWWGVTLGPIPSLAHIMTGPYCEIPASYRLNGDEGCTLLQTVPFEVFMIRLKVGMAAGAVLFAPFWLYQIWAFIAPGLYSNERKYSLTFVAFASILFAAGALLAYVLVPGALKMLVSFGAEAFTTALTGDKYISFVLSLLVIFGVSFEMPLLLVMLNRIGIVRYEQLKGWRRGLTMGLFVFAAFATPGNDPFSMLALALALVVLFELAIQICRLHDRKLARRRKDQGWDDLADDEAAPFDYAPSSADGEQSEEAAATGKGRAEDVT
ncbi:MAG: twin-arginine translocase subunit TatC [Haloechinothrix sp.]